MDKKLSNNTIIKSDLVDRVYEKVGFTRREAVEAVEILFNEIKLGLARGENVRIANFASFYLREKKPRNARNPKTGQPIRIKPGKSLSFKPSKQLLISANQSKHDKPDS